VDIYLTLKAIASLLPLDPWLLVCQLATESWRLLPWSSKRPKSLTSPTFQNDSIRFGLADLTSSETHPTSDYTVDDAPHSWNMCGLKNRPMSYMAFSASRRDTRSQTLEESVFCLDLLVTNEKGTAREFGIVGNYIGWGVHIAKLDTFSRRM
jgi:hypothetical protein